MTKRLGFTLVELIAVMGCLSVVMIVAATLLFQIFDLQTQTEETSEWTRSTNRLVSVFRKDVHRYGKPEIESEGEILLRWKSNGTTILYESMPGKYEGQRILRRTERSENDSVRMENYRLPDRGVLRFFEGRDTHDGLVALSLWKWTPQSTMPTSGEMNPFERTVPASQGEAAHVGTWRTVLARFKQTGGENP